MNMPPIIYTVYADFGAAGIGHAGDPHLSLEEAATAAADLNGEHAFKVVMTEFDPKTGLPVYVTDVTVSVELIMAEWSFEPKDDSQADHERQERHGWEQAA